MIRNHALVLSIVVAGLSCRVGAAVGPEPVPLWANGAPGQLGTEEADRAEIRIYRPDTKIANGCAVVICPGGGYGILATDHEGHQVAKYLTTIGVTGVVLKYRHSPKYKHPIPLNDAQRAIRYVRANTKELGVSANRIGIMGFSAGGHLASTAGTHFDAGNAEADDVIDRESCRPDFLILCYPVISFTAEFRHAGSARNLLGESATEELLTNLSNETQVTSETPPTFLFHTNQDAGVPPENSIAFYQACRRAKVPAELHIYQYGPHGVGLAPGDAATFTWRERMRDWLRASGFLSPAQRAAVEGTVRVNGEPLAWGMVAIVPKDNAQSPSGYAMVSRGNFRISADSGPAVGICEIQVVDLGAVAAFPTIENYRRLDRGEFVLEVKEGTNKITVEIDRK